MGYRCRCGTVIAHAFDELGCIECGTACCQACGVTLESVTYCARCASVVLELDGGVTAPGPAQEP